MFLGAKSTPNPGFGMQCNFFAFVETCENIEGKRMNISSDFFLCEHLKRYEQHALKEHKTVSKPRTMLLFSTALHATSFSNNNDFKQKNLETYIPRSCTERFGIVRNVPLSYSVNDLFKNAIKLRQRYPADKNKFIPKSIKFKFCLLPTSYSGDSGIFQNFARLKRPGALMHLSVCDIQMYCLWFSPS